MRRTRRFGDRRFALVFRRRFGAALRRLTVVLRRRLFLISFFLPALTIRTFFGSRPTLIVPLNLSPDFKGTFRKADAFAFFTEAPRFLAARKAAALRPARFIRAVDVLLFATKALPSRLILVAAFLRPVRIFVLVF